MDDDARLNELFKKHHDNLVRSLTRIVGDHARDIAQEAFINIWSKLGGIARGAEDSYLWRTGRNLAWNRLRDVNAAVRDERVTDSFDAEKHDRSVDSPEDLLVRREQTALAVQKLKPVIAAMPPLMRDIFILRLKGRKPREIVRLLNVKASVVTERLREARRRIHDSVGELPDGIDWTLIGEDE